MSEEKTSTEGTPGIGANPARLLPLAQGCLAVLGIIFRPVKALFILGFQWLFESSAFVLLPLYVYAADHFVTGQPLANIILSPEMMFTAIILHAEAMRKQIVYYRRKRGFEIKIMRVISIAILGIVLSAIFLVYSIHNEKDHALDSIGGRFFVSQSLLFVFALLNSVTTSLVIGCLRGEVDLLTSLDQETDDKPSDHRDVPDTDR